MEFESDSYEGYSLKPNKELYDLELAKAVSVSLQPIPGSQLDTPEETQKRVSAAILALIGTTDDS